MNERHQHVVKVNCWVIPQTVEFVGAQAVHPTTPRDLSADPAFSNFNLPIPPQDSPGGLATMGITDRSLVTDAEDIEDARTALRESHECMDYEEFRRELGID